MIWPDRRTLAPLFLVALLLATSILPGCSTQQQAPGQNVSLNQTDFGFRPGTAPGLQLTELPDFRHVKVDLATVVLDPDNATSENVSVVGNLLYLRASGLSDDGAAASHWLIATRHNNRTFLITYDRNGRHITPWTGVLPGSEMDLSLVMTPEDLLITNPAMTMGDPSKTMAPGRRDLVLSDNHYTLTLSGNGVSRVLVFNATTGALIRSNG